jgi:hypothetical protein
MEPAGIKSHQEQPEAKDKHEHSIADLGPERLPSLDWRLQPLFEQSRVGAGEPQCD